MRWMEQGIQACPYFWRQPVEDVGAQAILEAMEPGTEMPFQAIRSRLLDMPLPAELLQDGFVGFGMQLIPQHHVTG